MKVWSLVAYSLLSVACATQQHNQVIVAETDHLVRDVVSSGQVAELIGPPQRSFRRIATLRAWNDAAVEAAQRSSYSCDPPDCDAWSSLRVVAGQLGAHAIVFRDRELVPCERPAQFVSTADAFTATAVATGKQERVCVALTVDAVVVDGGRINCSAEANCRSDRNDRNDVIAARGRLEVDPRKSDEAQPAAPKDDEAALQDLWRIRGADIGPCIRDARARGLIPPGRSTLNLTLFVTASGKITRLRVREPAAMADSAVVNCLTNALESWTLATRDADRTVETSVALTSAQ